MKFSEILVPSFFILKIFFFENYRKDNLRIINRNKAFHFVRKRSISFVLERRIPHNLLFVCPIYDIFLSSNRKSHQHFSTIVFLLLSFIFTKTIGQFNEKKFLSCRHNYDDNTYMMKILLIMMI